MRVPEGLLRTPVSQVRSGHTLPGRAGQNLIIVDHVLFLCLLVFVSSLSG